MEKHEGTSFDDESHVHWRWDYVTQQKQTIQERYEKLVTPSGLSAEDLFTHLLGSSLGQLEQADPTDASYMPQLTGNCRLIGIAY